MYPPRYRSPCLPHASLLTIPWLSHSGQLSANTGTAAGTTFSYGVNPVPSLPTSKYILGRLDHKSLSKAAPSWHKRVKLLVFLPVLLTLSRAYKLPGGFVKCRFWFCVSGARPDILYFPGGRILSGMHSDNHCLRASGTFRALGAPWNLPGSWNPFSFLLLCSPAHMAIMPPPSHHKIGHSPLPLQ